MGLAQIYYLVDESIYTNLSGAEYWAQHSFEVLLRLGFNFWWGWIMFGYVTDAYIFVLAELSLRF